MTNSDRIRQMTDEEQRKHDEDREKFVKLWLLSHGWDGKNMDEAERLLQGYVIGEYPGGGFVMVKGDSRDITISNADRIRSMTDEELAGFLASLMPQFCGSCRLIEPDFIPMFYCLGKGCENGWIDWLKDYDRYFWAKDFWKGREPLKDSEKPLDCKTFVKENMKTVMGNACIPDGLQQKIMKTEGLSD